MKINKWVPFIVLVLVAAGIAVGVLNIRSASAAVSAVDELPSALSLKGDPGRGMVGYSRTDLAEALGITEEELAAAVQTAREAAINQGLEEGLITQAQADELTADDSTSRLDRVLSTWLMKSGIDFNALLADALGISMDELQAAYEQAFFTRIDQAVTDGKLTEEQALLAKGRYALSADSTFQASMKTAYEAAIQEAVTKGIITQEQADLILENASLKDFSGSRGILGLFGFDKRGGRPGHSDRGMLPEASEATETLEP